MEDRRVDAVTLLHFNQFNMGQHRKGSFSLCQLVAVVLMCRVTVGCAAVPDELEGLAGRVLKASEDIPANNPDGAVTKSSDSVSFVQPVEDEVVRKPGSFPCVYLMLVDLSVTKQMVKKCWIDIISMRIIQLTHHTINWWFLFNFILV